MPKVPRNLVDDAMYGDPPEVVLPANKAEKEEERDEFGRKLDKLVQNVAQVVIAPPKSKRDWVSLGKELHTRFPGAKVNAKAIGYILIEVGRDGFLQLVVQGSSVGYTLSTLDGLILGEHLGDNEEVCAVLRNYLTQLASDCLKALAG
jgi:hypothetical protein